ncbi:MAG: BlaI/MecI/CopY family transcriptional regulator [Lachnospiraceae bacterium]|nr:BlaI/MecI/CopY family transcriptional regulator [Lachnospiraceae bacterium]
MGDYKLADAEERFADIIWSREPVASSELVKICQQEMNWKKSTTYTVLKKLCEKGIFCNDNAVVRAVLSREDFYGM